MKKRWVFLAEVLLMVGICTWVGLSVADYWTPRPAGSIAIKVQLRGARDRVYLYAQGGKSHYQITYNGGSQEVVDPDEFARRITAEHAGLNWIEKLCNISSPLGLLWVSVGFLGQVLFTGRMIVQWVASEKSKRSVVPPIFWWMSLFGSTMLLLYFLWRMDAIGVLGQATGWFVYIHNLWLIYTKPNGGPGLGEDPAPAAELGATGEKSAR